MWSFLLDAASMCLDEPLFILAGWLAGWLGCCEWSAVIGCVNGKRQGCDSPFARRFWRSCTPVTG